MLLLVNKIGGFLLWYLPSLVPTHLKMVMSM